MRSLVKQSFKTNLRIMRILGFYSPQKYQQLYKLYTYTAYCLLTIPAPILAIIHLLVDENIDFAQVCDDACIICENACFIIKSLPFIRRGDKIRKSIYLLEQPVFNSYTKKQESIIDECIKVCKRICRINLTFVFFACFGFSTSPIFRGGPIRKLPLQIWLPFDFLATTKTYVLTYLFVTIGICHGAVFHGVIDPLTAGLACQAASQLKVLKNSLQHLSEYADDEINRINVTKLSAIEKKNLKSKIMYAKIKQCIIHHCAILDFVDNYEETYSFVVFTQFTASVLVLCNICLQLSMITPFTYRFFFLCVFLMTMILEIFLYSYYGTNLYEESNTLTTAIYMGHWYEFNTECRKALLVIMERSKRPLIVTAGKILDLSLVTFTTIIRRAYALLAVLKNY